MPEVTSASSCFELTAGCFTALRFSETRSFVQFSYILWCVYLMDKHKEKVLADRALLRCPGCSVSTAEWHYLSY